MKKLISLLLVAIMAFSVVAVGAVSASAAEGDIAYKAGSRIFFDNSDAKWDNVYMYAWNYGYANDFVPMESYNGSKTLLSVVVPVDIPEGATYFLFTNSTDWSGVQTSDIKATSNVNTFAPSADGKAVVESYTKYDDTEPEVAITPYSKTFTGTIEVTVYAFNVSEGEATYQLNDAEPVAFTEPTPILIDATTTVTVTAADATTTCTFTLAADAVITVDAGNYKGDMYVYTYGGDRIAPSFNEMKYDEDEEVYTYVLNGSAHVIFTTTDSWDTAVKFLIYNGNELAADQEPLVNFGQHKTFTVRLP